MSTTRPGAGIGVSDDDFFVDILDPNELSNLLKFGHRQFSREGTERQTQTLLILDDIACGDDVKRRTSELVKLAFSGRHDNMSVWLLSQQLTSVSKPFRENIGALVVFYTPSKSDLEAILSDYGGEITKEQAAGIYAAPEDTPSFQNGILFKVPI